MENKVSKNIGILYKAKHVLNRDRRNSLYFSFIHSIMEISHGGVQTKPSKKKTGK